MKKLFTFAALLAFGLAAPVMAQEEEDVTHFILNPGFDEDLTFQIDGTMKEAVSTETSLSDRSWAYIAADSTVYARPKTTSGQNRPDGRKMEAVNGFKGRVKGWTLESNAEFPKCEWTYFGTVAYDLEPQSVPIADDGTTYLEVPARPTEFDGGDGFVYLRAGWANSAIYKQEVKLPCAVYRLEYWTININPNTSAVAKDLTQIVCRKDVFKDEEGTGLSAQEWTKHSFEFTPVDKFTMQFGYEAANSTSGGQPIVGLDGIKLYKIGEADPLDLLREDLNDIYDQIANGLDTICVDSEGTPFEGLLTEARNIADDEYNENSLEEIQVSIATLKKAYDDAVAAAATANRVALLLKQANKLLAVAEPYPGAEAFAEVVNAVQEVVYGDESKAADMAAAEQNLRDAINAYYFSQEATAENPANYSFLIQNPWFVIEGREPVSNSLEDLIEAGLTTDDKNVDGWENGSTASATVGAYFKVGRPCYQLWATNFTGYMDMHQTLTGLPNGIYSLECDVITNTDALSDQHIYAHSSLGETEGYMTEAGVLGDWPSGDYEFYYTDTDTDPWETVKTAGTVIVNDGTLTIGARSTHNAEGEDISADMRRGSFWMSNYVLRYHGAATEEQIAEAQKARVALAESLQQGLHFNADKAVVADSIAKFQQTNDLAVLNGGIEYARTSEAKYVEIMEEGKTIPTVKETLEINPDEYGVGIDIVNFALQLTEKWIASTEASYKDVDARLQLMKNYVNTYVPAYIQAEDIRTSSEILSSKAAKDALAATMEQQKAQLVKDTLLNANIINEFITELQVAEKLALAQANYEKNPNGTDYTSFIMNPDLAEEAGWTFEKGTGDANSKEGQHYSGDTSRRYIDSYNSKVGELNYYAEQRIVGLPNGTYEVKAAVRTSANGAFLFTANGAEKADTVFTQIPLQTYRYFDEELQKDTTVNATNLYGAIWEEAYKEYNENGNADFFDVYNANNAQGHGWEWLTLPAVEVKNHELTIGVTTDSARTGQAFEGTWFSVTDWSLTLLQKGDNADWNGPITRVGEIRNAATRSIFSLDGRRVNGMNRAGLYIITENGQTRKVIVK